MFTVTACKLLSLRRIGIARAGADLALQFAIAGGVDGGEGRTGGSQSACGLATPRVARKMRRNWSLSRRMRPNRPSF